MNADDQPRLSPDSLEVPSPEERFLQRANAQPPLIGPPGRRNLLVPPHLPRPPHHPALAFYLQQQPQAFQHLEEVYNIHVISLFSLIVLTLSVLLAVISLYSRFSSNSFFPEIETELRFVMIAFALQLLFAIAEILAWLLDQRVPLLSASAAFTHICSWLCYIALLILISKVHLSLLIASSTDVASNLLFPQNVSPFGVLLFSSLLFHDSLCFLAGL